MECSNFEFRPINFDILGVFLQKIWQYDKQCSAWLEGSSRSSLIWVYTVCQNVYKLVSSTIRVKEKDSVTWTQFQLNNVVSKYGTM